MNHDEIEKHLRLLASFGRSVGHGDEAKDLLNIRVSMAHRSLSARLAQSGDLGARDRSRLLDDVAAIELFRQEARDRLWEFSRKKLHDQFVDAADAVLLLARHESEDVREVTRRLLWISQSTYSDVFAWLTPEFGYPAMWEGSNTVTRRLEFVRSFVGHDLLDDGDPGAMWIRHANWPEEQGSGMSPWIPCAPNEDGAWRILTPCREKWCTDYYREACVTPERVIERINEHEARNERRITDHIEEGATEEDLGELLKLDAWTGAIRLWMESEDILPTLEMP
jgi:hypothetical protein